jgi:hypothetical protein
MPCRPVGLLAATLLAAAITAPSSAGASAPRGRLPLTGAHTELVLAHGRTLRVHDPFLPAAQALPGAGHVVSPTRSRGPRVSSARARAARGPSVPAALSALQAAGAITPDQYRTWQGDYDAARSSLGRLLGTRRLELGAVLANVQAIAAAGGFIPSRLPALFLTLERNRQWWTTGALLSDSQRIAFSGSRLVWEYYAGQGLEIQWLGTFGKANGYYESGSNNANLTALLNEALPLAAQRAGGIAWEYLFRFDGGLPPWTSGLSQGTALQAYSRAWSRLHVSAFLTAAQQALGIFQTPPPEGVRVATPAGAHYLEYSYAPRERILNGFIQALIGLYDFSSLTGDQLGQQLFAAGDGEARVEVPRYDTGAWSLYDQSSESDLSYHDLLRDFLRNLCRREQTPLPNAPAPGSPAAGSTGGTDSGAQVASPRQTSAPSGIYCQSADHFTSYLHIPPVLSLVTTKGRAGTAVHLRFSLSKISNVAITVRRNGALTWSAHELAGHGTRSVTWAAPRQAGAYTVSLSATDLAGNSAAASGSVTLSSPPAPHRGKAPGRAKRP